MLWKVKYEDIEFKHKRTGSVVSDKIDFLRMA